MGQRANPILNRVGITNFGFNKSYPTIKKLQGLFNTQYIFTILHFYFLKLRYKLCYLKSYFLNNVINMYAFIYKIHVKIKKKKKNQKKFKVYKISFKYFYKK